MTDTASPTISVETAHTGFGQVTFLPGDPGQPATDSTRVSGNTTTRVVNAAIPATPARFEVAFHIAATITSEAPDGARLDAPTPLLHVTVPLPTVPDVRGVPPESYNEIEDRAAHALPALLHQIAERLAEQIAQTDARRREHATGSE